MTENVPGDEAIQISGDELLLLRHSAELSADRESPFGPLEVAPAPEVLERAARSLAGRGLADGKTFRPHREVVRRLLIVAQPDSRVVLLRAGPGQGERLLDLYQRAGAFVRYNRTADKHRFGPPLEFLDVLDEIIRYFRPRRSTGDFVKFRVGPAEHFAFSLLAAELVARVRDGASTGRLGGYRVPPRSDSNLLDPSMDGAIVLPGRRIARVPGLSGETPAPKTAIPTDEAWQAALENLAAKNIVQRVGDAYELRPYLHDLAIGLMTQSRHVLTRFDFGTGDWVVRDATFVPVHGSVFLLRATQDGGLDVRELDAQKLQDAVRRAAEEIPMGDTVDDF